jgi:PilZ domain
MPWGDRQAKRVCARVPVQVLTNQQTAESHPASTIDHSRLGIRVKSDAQFQTGQILEVIPNGTNDYILLCRVIWVGEPGTPSEGEAGLEFLYPLPEPLSDKEPN